MVYRLVVCIVISYLKLHFKPVAEDDDEMISLRFVKSIIDAFSNLFNVKNFSDYDDRNAKLMRASYICIYFENIIIFTVWIIVTKYNHTWYYWPSIGIIITFAVCYILCELIHYLCTDKRQIQYTQGRYSTDRTQPNTRANPERTQSPPLGFALRSL
jgi:hypothetical protein